MISEYGVESPHISTGVGSGIGGVLVTVILVILPKSHPHYTKVLTLQ